MVTIMIKIVHNPLISYCHIPEYGSLYSRKIFSINRMFNDFLVTLRMSQLSPLGQPLGDNNDGYIQVYIQIRIKFSKCL